MRQEEQFDNSPEDYSRPWEVRAWLNALETGDPRAEELAQEVETFMREARSQGRGSMFGVVSSMRNMTQAFEGLLQFLPENFVWPTILDVSPFSVYAEWGRNDATEGMGRAVWMVADASGVTMNANFRHGWPECGASVFDAQTVAGWLQELTQSWEWSAWQSDGRSESSLSRRSMNGS